VLEAQSQPPAGSRRHGVTRAEPSAPIPFYDVTRANPNFISSAAVCQPHHWCYTARGLRRWARRLRCLVTQVMNAAATTHQMIKMISATLEAIPQIFAVP
jgi:hypothetical protein